MNRPRKWSIYIESSFCSYAFNPRYKFKTNHEDWVKSIKPKLGRDVFERVTVPLGSHNGGCVYVSFISFHGADKFLLDMVLDIVASYSLPLPDTNDNIETSELLKEKWNKALNYYTEAIKLNGMNVTYYYNRAAAYLKLAWYEVSPICQLNVKAYLRCGAARESLLRYTEALEANLSALSILACLAVSGGRH
ncbi:hypothetical protein Ahy_A05g023579 [Arachis hypogaea]|uniref:Uncharacterized protein n=1 Tax=Arachis hypogaea TaxID=3818 RepID=A0A445D4G3_ARAHY|nr:hypothetical protein Ahy_A05g023579 [Arachis hypogaea]